MHDCKHLVILDTKKGKVAQKLKQLFEKLVPSVVITDSLESGVSYVLDLEGLNTKSDTETDLALFSRMRSYANQGFEQGFYMIIGMMDETSIWDKSGFTGLAKTAALELPALSIRAIGVEQAIGKEQELAQAIYLETLLGGETSEIFYDKEFHRFQLSGNDQLVGNTKVELAKNATVLVTGGGRGVTADCIIELAQHEQYKFALLGRTALFEEKDTTLEATDEKALKLVLIQDAKNKGEKINLQDVGKQASSIIANREIKQTIETLKGLGSEAVYYSTDVTDSTTLQNTVDKITSSMGEIAALIHGAGVLADKYIKDKTDEQFLRVYSTKVAGFKNLLEATKEQPITHVCCFSSVAGRYGNVGQADYSMANEVLNKMCVALAKKEQHMVVKSFNWGPWIGGMVTPQIKAHFESMGIEPIPKDQGVEVFVRDLFEKRAAVEVVVGNGLENWKDQLEKRTSYTTWVQESTFPIYKDHQINGVVVVPMVSIIHQVYEIGKHLFNAPRVTVKDVKVYNGIKIEDFANEGVWLNHEIKLLDSKNAEVILTSGTSQHPNYKLSISSDVAESQLLSKSSMNEMDNLEEALKHLESYFHGSGLRAIDSLDSFSKEGADYKVKGFVEQNTSLRLMDGALQAAVIHAELMGEGAKAVPLGCESFRFYSLPAEDAKLLYRLKIIEQQEQEFTTTIQLVEANTEELYFEFSNVKMVIYELGLIK